MAVAEQPAADHGLVHDLAHAQCDVNAVLHQLNPPFGGEHRHTHQGMAALESSDQFPPGLERRWD